ncbi:MAG: General stress protein CTC [Syntrophus sp. SKADARSKE-3]|nr:General stress protein CTC [Syntrophus sp. SKADARSKE-3]
MEAEQLKAFTRTESGKCPARRLRSQGMIPAILYGPRTENVMLSVNAAELKRLLIKKEDKKFFRLSIEDDGKTVDKLSIVKKYETHPMGNQLIHADFYEISLDRKIALDVPVRLKGTSIGVEMGGELQQQKRVLRVSCLPDQLPEEIVIDITDLKVGDTLKVKDIALGDGISIQDGEDLSVVMILSTRAAMKASDQSPAGAAQADAKQKSGDKKPPAKKK